MTFSELIKIIETDVTDNNYKVAADFLLTAITDWPTYNLTESSDLISELKSEVRNRLTYDNLDDYSNSLDLEKDAWKIEAISSLLEMFDFERKNKFDKIVELETIIDRLTRHYRKNNNSNC